MHSSLILVAATCLLCVSGCATHAKRISGPRQAFYANNIEQSFTQLEKLANKRSDKDCVELDLAIVDLTRGNAAACENRLRKVRDRFDHLEQKSLAEAATSYWTDDRTRAYAGEEYERILLRAFLAMSNLFNSGIDAESYTLQLDQKQQAIYDAAYERLGDERIGQYPIVPIGFYLRGMLREATFHDYDEAIANYGKVCELYPDVRAFAYDLHRATQGVHSQPGMGVVYIFTLVGQGPQKVAVSEQPTSDVLLIADRIVSAAGPYHVPPTIAPIQVPAIQITPSTTDQVFVNVDHRPIGATETIADVDRLAIGAYELNRKEILARAVARRIIKKTTIVAAKDTMNTDPLVSLAMDAAGVAWEATEVADTRCWSLLPSKIQVIRIEMPKGRHTIGLRAMRHGRPFGSEYVSEVDVRDAANTYVMAYLPQDRVIGQVLVSR